jgi:hypothetical protein
LDSTRHGSDSVKFYFASLCANGNGTTSGDNAVTGYKRAQLVRTNPTADIMERQNFAQIYPTIFENKISVKLLQSDIGTLQLFDIQGHIVFEKKLYQQNDIYINNLNSGIYIAKVSTGQKTMSLKLFKQ